MSEPIAVRVTRYKCPHCARTASNKARSREHIGRCWHNPDARGCKTCKHFEAYAAEYGDDCAVGVDLAGRPACESCKGTGIVAGDGLWNPEKCSACAGHPDPVKPGPIVHCDQWEAES